MDVKQIAVERAIKMLDAAGAKYAIVLPDGTRLGVLQVAEPKVLPLRRAKVNPGITAYVKVFLAPMQVGGEVTVPTTPEFSLVSIQTACAQSAGALWGRGNFVTHRVENGVQVLRCA